MMSDRKLKANTCICHRALNHQIESGEESHA